LAPLTIFRVGLMVSAVSLGAYAMWISGAEITRTRPPSFPIERGSESRLELERAAIAASIGIIRGDLWADYAILLSSRFLNENMDDHASTSPGELLAVQAAVEKAATLAPHDSRIWLLLAMVYSQTDTSDARVGRSLMMSYFTGANNTTLMPLRLKIATRLQVISNIDLQVLVSGEIRTIILSKPNLQSAIVDAYNSANPAGKQLVINTLRDLDPDLLSVVRRSH
jgi:hypothetical protein